jgi:hypothetical protein
MPRTNRFFCSVTSGTSRIAAADRSSRVQRFKAGLEGNTKSRTPETWLSALGFSITLGVIPDHVQVFIEDRNLMPEGSPLPFRTLRLFVQKLRCDISAAFPHEGAKLRMN